MSARSDVTGYIEGVRERVLDMAEWCEAYEKALPEQAADLRKVLRENAGYAVDSAAALRRRCRARIAGHEAELAEIVGEIKAAKARDEKTLEILDRQILELLEVAGEGDTCVIATPAATLSLRWSPESVGINEEDLAIETLPASIKVEKRSVRVDKKAALARMKAGEVFPGLYRKRDRKVVWK